MTCKHKIEGKKEMEAVEGDRERILHSWAQAVSDYSRTEDRQDRTEGNIMLED